MALLASRPGAIAGGGHGKIHPMVDWTNPVDTLWFGAATGILMAVLIQYYQAKEAH